MSIFTHTFALVRIYLPREGGACAHVCTRKFYHTWAGLSIQKSGGGSLFCDSLPYINNQGLRRLKKQVHIER